MYVTDALILKRESLSEADLLITALTPRFVKIRLVARGVRKAGAKLKGHIEPLSLSSFSFVAGRSSYRLTGAELKNFFSNIKGSSGRFRIASEIISTLDGALFEDVAEGNGNFFVLTSSALEFLDEPSRTADECARILLWFRMQFLRESGLLPEGIAGSLGALSARRIPCGEFVSLCGEEQAATIGKVVAHLFRTYLYR